MPGRFGAQLKSTVQAEGETRGGCLPWSIRDDLISLRVQRAGCRSSYVSTSMSDCGCAGSRGFCLRPMFALWMLRKSGILPPAHVCSPFMVSARLTSYGVYSAHTEPWLGISRKIAACENPQSHCEQQLPMGLFLSNTSS